MILNQWIEIDPVMDERQLLALGRRQTVDIPGIQYDSMESSTYLSNDSNLGDQVSGWITTGKLHDVWVRPSG